MTATVNPRERMEQLNADWSAAAKIDESLAPFPAFAARLARQELCPESYSRTRVLEAMARQRPILVWNSPLRGPLRDYFFRDATPETRLRELFGTRRETIAKFGRTQRRRKARISEVVDRWREGRVRVSANDVYFRPTRLSRAVKLKGWDECNVLHHGGGDIRNLEVATVLMGTAGCMTDSHSDDPDGSNHCVFGRKLWLVWDRREGRRHGIEDCEYDPVFTFAKFPIEGFTKVKSARWFTVSAGQTLFLPGNLTHKVVTIERYLGLSSFYVNLANGLASLSRWKADGATYIKGSVWDGIADLVAEQLERAAAGDRGYRFNWGFYQMTEALRAWRAKYTRVERDELRSSGRLGPLIDRMTGLSRGRLNL